MNQNYNYKKITSSIKAELAALLIILFSLFFFSYASAATKTFSGVGNFGNAARWSPSAPVAGDSLVITGTCTIENNPALFLAYGGLYIGNGSADTLIWAAGGTDTLSVNTITSGFAGSRLDMTNGGCLIVRWTWPGTNLDFIPGVGTVDLRWGTGIKTLPANVPVYNNLTLAITVKCSLAVNTTITGNFVQGSIATINLCTFDLTIQGNWTRGGSSVFTHNNRTVTFNGSRRQSMGGVSTAFYNLVVAKPADSILVFTTQVQVANNLNLNSGNLTYNMALNISTTTGTLFQAAGTTISSGGPGTIFDFYGNWNIESGAAFAAGTGMVRFMGGSNQTIDCAVSSLTLNDVYMWSGATVTVAGNLNTINLTGSLIIVSGEFVAPPTLIVNGNVTFSGGTLTAGDNITVGGNWTKISTSTFTPGTGTVTFDGSANQAIQGTSATQTFNDLTINKSAGILDTGQSTVALNVKSLTLSSGTFTAPPTMNVSGNWIQTGGTFIPGTFAVNLNGSTNQNLGGSTFYNLVVANTAGAALEGNVNVTNNLNLSTGSVSLATSDLTIGSSAVISGADSTRYIITTNNPASGGFLIQQVVNVNKVFPVGTSTYTPVTLRNSNVADNYKVRVFNGVYTGGTSGSLMSRGVNRTWLVEETVLNGSNVIMTIQWNIADENVSFDRGNCALFHYTAAAWDDTSFAAATVVSPGVYSRSRSNIHSFSPFGAGDDILPLPVELLSFSAKHINKTVELNWTTATEINNSHFNIELSADGQNFETIARTEGSGNSNSVLAYEFTDNDPILAGISYYRLKQVDYDGSSSYSTVQVIKPLEFTISLGDVYPMPMKETLTIQLQNTFKGVFLVNIQDLTGRVLYTESFQLASGSQNMVLPTAGLPQGMYMLSISNSEETLSVKLIK